MILIGNILIRHIQASWTSYEFFQILELVNFKVPNALRFSVVFFSDVPPCYFSAYIQMEQTLNFINIKGLKRLTPMGTAKMDPFSWSPISLRWMMERIVWPRVVKVRPFILNLNMKEFHINELRGRYHQKNFSQPSPQGTVSPWELSS